MNPRIVIPDSEIRASLSGPLTVDQIEMGPISIPKATLKGFAGEFAFSTSIAHDVHIAVKLKVKLEFAFGISVDWWFDQWAEGDIEFHPFTQEANLHNVSFIPAGNNKIKISSDKDLSMGPVSVKPEAIGNGTTKVIKIEDMKLNDIRMKCTEVPLSNPLGLTAQNSIPIKNPMDTNDVLVEETDIKNLTSANIQTPPVTINDIASNNIEISSARTSPFKLFSNTNLPDLIMNKDPTDPNVADRHGDATRVINLALSRVTLKVLEVTLDVRGGLEFLDIKGSIRATSATSDNFGMDLEMKSMKIKGLNICGMKIPEVMVEF